MTRRLLSIAANTFRETVRNKILYVILAFALVVIGLTWFLADLSMGELARIVADVGLASIHLFGVTIAVFLGITLVSQEMERKTIYIILSKPVPRWEFVLGKAAADFGQPLGREGLADVKGQGQNFRWSDFDMAGVAAPRASGTASKGRGRWDLLQVGGDQLLRQGYGVIVEGAQHRITLNRASQHVMDDLTLHVTNLFL